MKNPYLGTNVDKYHIMKKFGLTCLAISFLSLTMSAQGTDWSRVANASVGVGVVSYEEKSPSTFTQQVGMQWKIKNDLLIKDLSLSVGFAVNNSYGGKMPMNLSGAYDYEYISYVKVESPRTGVSYNNSTVRRIGSGKGTANLMREDLSIMPTVSLNYVVMPRLEVYATFGIGVGMMHQMFKDLKAVSGFEKDSDYQVKTLNGTKRTFYYSYNDLDHVNWGEDALSTEACLAISFYAGARYWLTDRWSANANVGLVSANIKESMGNSYNVFSIGASYSF